jgi:putative two-component system response regulator
LIHRLALTTEMRDNETGNHIERIGYYVYELGKKIGLDEEYCTLLKNAAKMHDIGKISIADEILLKPGSLSDEEWEIMKTHTVNGAQILAGSSSRMIKMAEEIALSHHEKWDGSGYPKGLRGEEIPLTGRITAICDVFDALISERPYKNDWELGEVIKEIKRGAGSHFEPSLVAYFLEIIPVILNIRETQQTDTKRIKCCG